MSDDDNTSENPESYPQKFPYFRNVKDRIAAEKAEAYANGATFRDVYFEEWSQAEDARYEQHQAEKREAAGHEDERRRSIMSRDNHERERG